MKTNYLFILLISVLFLSCGTQNRDTKTKDVSYYEYTGRPSQALTYKEVASMLRHYDNTRVEALKKTNNGKKDTRENFYALEDLKAYIAYVEKLAKDKKIKITGINIISAAYPDDARYKEKANYQTLIFMPATKIGDKNNVSFDPLYSQVGKPKLFAEILYSKFHYSYRGYQSNTARTFMKNTAIKTTTDGDDMESSAANRTHISPPY
ncbi:MAG: hypothetical protein JKY44_04695 [Flavobacteriaceae bacterium]|nr:hypothetical protein [Flavobacteriaceae bacterium]